MDTTNEQTPKTVIGVIVTSVHDTYLSGIVKQCGRTFKYETHLAVDQAISLRVACMCPGGHGVAGLPWRGWLDTSRGRFDLADVPAPAPAAAYETLDPDYDAQAEAAIQLAAEFIGDDLTDSASVAQQTVSAA